MLLHVFKPSTLEMEAAGLGIQGQPWLYSEFLPSLGCVKRNKTKIITRKFGTVLGVWRLCPKQKQK